MESIFENTTTLTRQNLTEMARATVPRWSLLVGIIPAVLAVAAAIWDLARRGISLWAGLLLLAAFALVMTTYGAPARVALKIAKRNFKKYGSEVTATLCFYEDMVMASACSTISGTSSFRRSARLNILSNLLSPFPLQKLRAPIVPRPQHNCKCRFQQGAG